MASAEAASSGVQLSSMAPVYFALTVLLAVTLHASRTAIISASLLATLGLIGYAQFFIWENWRDGIFTSHWLYMTLLLRAGTQALRGDGFPVKAPPTLGVVATIVLCIIAVHETVVTHLHAFHNYVHITLYISGALLAHSSCSEQLATGCFGAAAALRVRSVRVLSDPAILFAMGLLLIGHQHDPAPLSVALHSTFGYCLVALATCCFLCSLVHASLPRESPACDLMRSLHALAWILTGAVTYTMCAVTYLTPHGGFKAYLDSTGIKAKTNEEEALTYVAATVLGSAFHLALLHWSSGEMMAEGQGRENAKLRTAACEETESMIDAHEEGVP